MPIYEYRCERCGREFEEWQKFSDHPVETCTVCGGGTHRLISQSTFILKGTGWYVTDYARQDKNSRAGCKPKEDTAGSSASSD